MSNCKVAETKSTQVVKPSNQTMVGGSALKKNPYHPTNIKSAKGKNPAKGENHAKGVTQFQAEPKSYEFFAPTPRFPKWEADLACAEAGYVIMDSVDEKKNPFTDNTTPTVFFAANVLQEMQYVVNTLAPKTGECGGYFLMKQLQDDYPQFLVYDFFMVGQEASAGEVELCGYDSKKYFDYLREKYPDELKTKFHNKLGHWHSHGSLGK